MWRFLKKLEIEVPYNPAIPLLSIHTKETHQQMPNLENKKRELQEKRYLQRKPEQFLLTEERVGNWET